MLKILRSFFWFFAVTILFTLTFTIIVVFISFISGVSLDSPNNQLMYAMLAVCCLVWSFCGAFLSLAFSRISAKFIMRLKVIDPKSAYSYERELLEDVYRLAEKAGITKMPEVAVYESLDINAFATGPTRNRSLVAVSKGLLGTMSKKELEGVLAHEVAHIVNGDMLTMTLLQGVMNAFVMFFARIIGYSVSIFLKGPYKVIALRFVIIVCEILFGLLAALAVCWFSRLREFRADVGAARLAGGTNIIAALQKLNTRPAHLKSEDMPHSFAALGISNARKERFAAYNTHPTLEERIKRLRVQFGN